jgi:hypothetical protein
MNHWLEALYTQLIIDNYESKSYWLDGNDNLHDNLLLYFVHISKIILSKQVSKLNTLQRVVNV